MYNIVVGSGASILCKTENHVVCLAIKRDVGNVKNISMKSIRIIRENETHGGSDG